MGLGDAWEMGGRGSGDCAIEMRDRLMCMKIDLVHKHSVTTEV